MKNLFDVVLDTNILVSALWSSNGSPAEIVEMMLGTEITSYYCKEIIAEYKKVLFRDKFKSKFSEDEINLLLGYIIEFGNEITPITSKKPFNDESDRIFYDTAITSGAILITGNVKHFPHEKFIMLPSNYINLWKQSIALL